MVTFAKLSRNRSNQRTTRAAPTNRRGTATIEAALLTPLMLIITMGVLEVGQFVVLSQMVSNASRVGGRIASRDSIENVNDVENAVLAYFSHSYPGMEGSELANAVDVQVSRANGTQLNGNDLRNIPTGERLRVVVTADFSAFKWDGTIEYWLLELSPVTCFSRRE
jgi:Flp pilus assembly protein TadG